MKRLIFFLALFSLTFSLAIASDVGKESLTPKGGCIQVEHVYQVMPVINAVNFETAQVVLNFKAVDVGTTGNFITGILFKPEPFNKIDPGIYAQVSVSNNIKIYTHNYSYTPYLLITTNYLLPTTYYILPTNNTARHV